MKKTELKLEFNQMKSLSGEICPDGLRVLVVDDDKTCLRILHKMLLNCLYQVTKCSGAAAALELLRENKEAFDIVICDVHMPDMDGFKLLQHIGLEIDLPVVMMSSDDSKNVVMKGIVHGACDYLIKPVRMEALQYIWKHVVRRKKHQWKNMDVDQLGTVVDGEHLQKAATSSANGGNRKTSKKHKDEDDDGDNTMTSSSSKKPRVTWSNELHQQFVRAIEYLGVDNAVPKKILAVMNVPHLTRENVASHLQKYRLHLKKLSETRAPELGSSSSGRLGMTLACPGHVFHRPLLPPQNLCPNFPSSMPLINSRNSFEAGSSGIRFVEHQHQQQGNINYRPVPLLGGSTSNVDSIQPTFGPTSGQVHGKLPQRSPSLLPHSVQQQQASSRISNLSSYLSQPVLCQPNPSVMTVCTGCVSIHPSTSMNQRLDTFPATTNLRTVTPVSTGMSQKYPDLSMETERMIGGSMKTVTPVSTGMSQEYPYSSVETERVIVGLTKTTTPMSMGMSQNLIPNYGVLDTLTENRADNWGFDSIRPNFDVSQHQDTVQTGFSSDNGLGNGIKPEHPSVFDNTLFPHQFDQEDLCSFFNQHQEDTTLFGGEFNFDSIHFDNLLV